MFCLMMVSGSMDEARKELSKRFFILLYLSSPRTTTRSNLVLHSAITRRRGSRRRELLPRPRDRGTVVSSALVLMDEIIKAALRTEPSGHLWRPGQRR